MTTAEKSQAIIAAVKEFETIYAAVIPPATPAEYTENIGEGMRKGLTEKIAAIMKS